MADKNVSQLLCGNECIQDLSRWPTFSLAALGAHIVVNEKRLIGYLPSVRLNQITASVKDSTFAVSKDPCQLGNTGPIVEVGVRGTVAEGFAGCLTVEEEKFHEVDFDVDKKDDYAGT